MLTHWNMYCYNGEFFLSIESLDHVWEESEVCYKKTRGFMLLRSPGFLADILADFLCISWRDYFDLFHIILNFLNKFKRAWNLMLTHWSMYCYNGECCWLPWTYGKTMELVVASLEHVLQLTYTSSETLKQNFVSLSHLVKIGIFCFLRKYTCCNIEIWCCPTWKTYCNVGTCGVETCTWWRNMHFLKTFLRKSSQKSLIKL
jgi:hypothetical protein